MNALDFVTHNSSELNTGGTHLQGEIKATFKELCAIFGKPHGADEYKSDAGWDIRFGDGTIASIYNWKDGPNYCGEHGTPVEQIGEWHVGGLNRKALEHVEITLELHREMQTEPKNPADEIRKAHFDLLDSIKSKHGEPFAMAVEFCYLVHKQTEVFKLVLGGAQSGEVPPEHIVELLRDAFSTVSSRVMHRFISNVCPEAVESRVKSAEMMDWTDRLLEVEQSGVSALMSSLNKKGRK